MIHSSRYLLWCTNSSCWLFPRRDTSKRLLFSTIQVHDKTDPTLVILVKACGCGCFYHTPPSDTAAAAAQICRNICQTAAAVHVHFDQAFTSKQRPYAAQICRNIWLIGYLLPDRYVVRLVARCRPNLAFVFVLCRIFFLCPLVGFVSFREKAGYYYSCCPILATKLLRTRYSFPSI